MIISNDSYVDSPFLIEGRKSSCICWWSSGGLWRCSSSNRSSRSWFGYCRGCQVIMESRNLVLTRLSSRLGLSLLERRLQRRSAAARPDPLRGVSAKSRTKTKSRKGSSASSGTSHDSGNQVIDLTVDSPLQQLNALFPHLETHALSAVLASTNNSLAEAVEVVLAQSTDLPTPGSSSGPTTTSMPPLLSPASSSPLPPCPECPVCLSSLRGCRIYQCKEGHSLCHQCKNNPQV